MKLAADEQHIWWIQSQVRGYPRWRKYSGGFLLYVTPDSFMEEVFKNFGGTWSVGRKSDGTERVFAQLQDALNYGELLNLRQEFADLKSRFNPEYASLCGTLEGVYT